MANRVHLDPILAASGSICGTQAHIRGTKSSFWDTLEPPLMTGQTSLTSFEIPCRQLRGTLHDVHSGIAVMGEGAQLETDPCDLARGQGCI